MATLITINGDTSNAFVAENVTSLLRDTGGDGSYDITVCLGADRRYYAFDLEVDRDTVFDSIVSAIGTVTDILP